MLFVWALSDVESVRWELEGVRGECGGVRDEGRHLAGQPPPFAPHLDL